MLSYQHIYHAGNLADVHKHALLAAALSYLTRKDKPLTYIETHAGRALYALDSAEAQKTGEAEAGIMRVEASFPNDHPYRQALASIRAEHGAMAYPGSPLLAATLLRPADRMVLAELHPREFSALQETMARHGAECRQIDGRQLALSATPPKPRRGMILIDPSYELKSDYGEMPALVAKLHRRWNVGIVALWYPILVSGLHRPMAAALAEANLPGTLHHEISFTPSREGHGMVGSGMFFVNAPYGLDAEARHVKEILRKFS
jgi:23S rRNA (adenine2030-N6)-methyltransferase